MAPWRETSPGATSLVVHDISFKDQELLTSFAKELGVPVLLANVREQAYRMARAAGFDKDNGTAVIKVLERPADVRAGGTASG